MTQRNVEVVERLMDAVIGAMLTPSPRSRPLTSSGSRYLPLVSRVAYTEDVRGSKRFSERLTRSGRSFVPFRRNTATWVIVCSDWVG